MGVGYLFFELSQLGSLGFRVKETSSVRLRGALIPHSVRAILITQMYPASTIFLLFNALLFKRVGAEELPHLYIDYIDTNI